MSYFLRDHDGRLTGIMGVHVDDTAVGGPGNTFEQSIAKLRTCFPYRKWRVGQGNLVALIIIKMKTLRRFHVYADVC